MLLVSRGRCECNGFADRAVGKYAHFAEGDHSFHGITITRFGHHDRSEATLWS
jgi:hypothetical protein